MVLVWGFINSAKLISIISNYFSQPGASLNIANFYLKVSSSSLYISYSQGVLGFLLKVAQEYFWDFLFIFPMIWLRYSKNIIGLLNAKELVFYAFDLL
jgi:hypothetical protein